MGWGERSNAKVAAQPANVPIIGQPITVLGVGVPMNMDLKCNCQSDNEVLQVRNSAPVQCVNCNKTYNALYNPSTNKVDMHVTLPQKQEIPA